MSDCTFCDLIAGKKNLLYEDDKIFAMLFPNPAVPGHIVLMPKTHTPILEQVPDYVIGDMFVKANKISTAVFEGIRAHGTNILIQNGVAAGQTHNHFMVHILPRFQNDELNLLWQPKQIPDDQMEDVEARLKESTSRIGEFEQEPSKPIEKKDVEELSPEEDYLLKQLDRLP